jgi:hypothetical protein
VELFTAVSVCVLLVGTRIVSMPLPLAQFPPNVVSLLAAVMALANVHVPPTLMVAASAGA